MEPADPLYLALREWWKFFMRRSMRDFVVHTKEVGLTPSHFAVLGRIDHEGAQGVSDIGDHLGISNAAASQMLDRLVQQGLITRSEDPHDRRAKQLLLTDKGRQQLHKMMAARMGWLEEMAASLSPTEREQVTAAINILNEKASQIEKQPER